MPTFPSITSASTDHVDQGSDSISLARADIKTNFDNVNSIITTFDGKTLVATQDVQAFTSQQYFTQATLTTDSANAFAWNLNTQQVGVLTLTASSQLDAPNNQQAGGVYTLIVKQDGTGGYTLSFDNTYKFPAGVAPIISTAANAVDVLSFVSDGTNLYGNIIQDLKRT